VRKIHGRLRVAVIRSGYKLLVPLSSLVVGDLVIVNAGQRIDFDVVIIAGSVATSSFHRTLSLPAGSVIYWGRLVAERQKSLNALS
jgi:hypothetical protein